MLPCKFLSAQPSSGSSQQPLPRSRSAPRRSCVRVRAAGNKEVTLLDYGAGNVRSVRNAIMRLGYSIKDVSTDGFRLWGLRRSSQSSAHGAVADVRIHAGQLRGSTAEAASSAFPQSRSLRHPSPLAAQVEKPSDISNADRLIFPGVGAFGQAMAVLKQRGYTEALKDYVQVRDHPECHPTL